MKKKEIIDIYTFLANGVKMNALKDADVRSSFISFFRGIKAIADPIYKELSDAEEPPLGEAKDEVVAQILGETIDCSLPKIKEEYLMSVIAESGLTVPVSLVLNVFESFVE